MEDLMNSAGSSKRPLMSTPISLEERLVSIDRHPTGFDFLRVLLATSVVVWHSIEISYGVEAKNAILASHRTVPALILPMFFSLSGFLVAGSLNRTKTLATFLALRGVRIFPALVVETVLSALVLGPLFTSMSIQQYFTSAMLYQYLWNILGYVHYTLPGVFLNNPSPEVINGQLWTVPFELECYILLAALASIWFIMFPRLILIAVLVAQLAFAWRAIFGGPFDDSLVPGRVLVLAFLSGAGIFYWRQTVPWSKYFAIGTFLLSIALLMVHGGAYFVAIPLAYFTVYIGLLNPSKPALLRTGDYSYGIFLYGFPIQQAITTFGPWTHSWYVNLAVSLPIIGIFSAISWHGVEKHALRLRYPLEHWEGAWLQWRGAKKRAQSM